MKRRNLMVDIGMNEQMCRYFGCIQNVQTEWTSYKQVKKIVRWPSEKQRKMGRKHNWFDAVKMKKKNHLIKT